MKELHGSRIRNKNAREPKFKGKPECPDFLDPLAKKEWQRIMTEFGDLGLITAADQACLASYCQSFARWRQAEEMIARDGAIVEEPILSRSGHVTGHRTKRHPAVMNSKDAQANMIAIGRLFGFDPSSRVHLAVPEAPAPESNYDESDSDIFVN